MKYVVMLLGSQNREGGFRLDDMIAQGSPFWLPQSRTYFGKNAPEDIEIGDIVIQISNSSSISTQYTILGVYRCVSRLTPWNRWPNRDEEGKWRYSIIVENTTLYYSNIVREHIAKNLVMLVNFIILWSRISSEYPPIFKNGWGYIRQEQADFIINYVERIEQVQRRYAIGYFLEDDDEEFDIKDYRRFLSIHQVGNKTIRIFHTSTRIHSKMPLIIMNDGQNIFFDEDATFKKSWKFYDLWMENKFFDAIIVGIDSDANRINDYTPFPFDDTQIKEWGVKQPGGQGDAYLDYVVNQVIPYVKNHFKIDPSDITIGGSSLGGVISLYALFKYPEVFKRAICLSNAFFCQGSEYIDFLTSKNSKHIKRLYLDVGAIESEEYRVSRLYTKTNQEVYDALKIAKVRRMRFKVVKRGCHNEESWAKRLKTIIRYVYSDLIKKK